MVLQVGSIEVFSPVSNLVILQCKDDGIVGGMAASISLPDFAPRPLNCVPIAIKQYTRNRDINTEYLVEVLLHRMTYGFMPGPAATWRDKHTLWGEVFESGSGISVFPGIRLTLHHFCGSRDVHGVSL